MTRSKIKSDRGGSGSPSPRTRKICFRCENLVAESGLNTKIFGKSFAGAIFLFLGGPAGGSALERASPHEERLHMACRDDKQYFKDCNAGETYTTPCCEESRCKVFVGDGFSKISRDPVDRSLF